MAPAAPEVLLLGLMHFALARLDIWHWKVLKMLLQNSSILIAVAFLPSTTTDWCSWDGQPLQLGESPGKFQATGTCFPLAFSQPGCFLPCSPLHVDKWLHQKGWCPHGAPAQAGVGIWGTHPCLGAGGLAHKGRIPAFSGYSGGLLGS